jgi:hypothetical protein
VNVTKELFCILTDARRAADPLVKYFPRKAVVTTLLPRGVPFKPRTEVVYV